MRPASAEPLKEKISNPAEARPTTPPAAWSWETHSWLGLCATILGTILAIYFVPVHNETAGTLMRSSLLMGLGLIVVPLRVLFTSPHSILHPIAITAASPVYWLLLDLAQGTYGLENSTQSEIRLAFLAIGLFSGSVWLASLARPRRVPRLIHSAASVTLSQNTLFGIGIVAFCLAFLRFAIPANFDLGAMLASFSENRWAAPWSRGSIGGWDAFLDHIGYFGYILPPIAAFLVRRKGIFHWRTVILLAMTFILLALFSTGGGRRIVGVMVGSGLVVWFLSAKRPSRKDLLVLAALGTGLLMFMQTMLIYRGVGITAAFTEQTDGADVDLEDKPKELRVDDNFLRLVQTIHIVPELHPHTGIGYLVFVAARPIPRVFWPGKPLNIGFDLPAFAGVKGASLSMSLVGELYLAFGFPGCVGGGLLLGYLANTLSQVLRAGATPGALIIFGGSLLALFAGMRSGIDLVLMSYGVLAWIGLTWVRRRLLT